MNKFTEYSHIERMKMEQLFTKHNITKYEFTDSDGYDRYDGLFFNSKNERIFFEVKNRKVYSNQYTTSFIDYSKYEFLIELNKKTGDKVFVFIFYSDDKVLIQDLTKANITKTEFNCPRTTAGDQTKVLKQMATIEINSKNLIDLN